VHNNNDDDNNNDDFDNNNEDNKNNDDDNNNINNNNNNKKYDDVTVLWNQRVQTDSEVLENSPHIIITHKKDKICLLIDIAISSDKNVTQKEADKKLKYKNLSREIQRMWNMK
jgi:hypothetical protein